jgi:3-hydroxyisobutyrate dehydrogenase-like beta-hydroxyacid dehydrogenase
MKIGFIGLGTMGSRMAANVQRAGHDLVVFNRTAEAARSLVELGATLADSPAGVGEHADVLFTMLAHPAAVQKAALGKNGFLDKMRAKTLWIDCSTVNPSFSRDMSVDAAVRRVRFLDAPVAGSKEPAAEGKLTFFVGGDEADLEETNQLLLTMGTKIVHVGGHGMGTSLKMVNNLLLGVSMAAYSEGLVLGQSLGIPLDRMFEYLLGSAVVAPYLANKHEKFARGDYEAELSLQWVQKDLHLAAVTAQETSVPLPLTNTAKETYQLAARAGFGREDFSAIYAFLNTQREQQQLHGGLTRLL